MLFDTHKEKLFIGKDEFYQGGGIGSSGGCGAGDVASALLSGGVVQGSGDGGILDLGILV